MREDRPNIQKSSISGSSGPAEIGEFWDNHDLTDFEAQTRDVTGEIEIAIQAESHLVALDPEVMRSAIETARERGIALETLVNLAVREATKRST